LKQDKGKNYLRPQMSAITLVVSQANYDKLTYYLVHV
jgi:hypothetical protein